MRDRLILVDKMDNVIGYKRKKQVHLDGDLHRAFSIFIFNKSGRLLIQKRSYQKYHSPGRWSNSCCSHPWGELKIEKCALIRLNEEIGIKCELNQVHKLIYNLDVGGQMYEHEMNTIFCGVTDKEPLLNPQECEDFTWIDFNLVTQSIEKQPHLYSSWFKFLLQDRDLIDKLYKFINVNFYHGKH